MARTWRKGFVLFLTILTLTTLGRSIIPGNELGTTCMVNCPPKSEWPEAENTNRQNISLSHQSLMHSIQSQNQKGDWSQVNQTTTYLKSIRCPTPLQPHNPIIVGSDADFAIQGWPGNGTQENPYSIRDLNITGDDDCIQIGNTSVHFVVENCWLGLGDWGRSGITIDNVTHGLIANTTSVNRVFGIRMTFSESIEFFNNTCINTSYGISVSDSNAIKIFNNTCSNSNFGLLIFDSSSTEIINNTIRNCEYFGCEIYPVNNNILVNNSLVNCGFLFGSWNYLFGSPRSVGVGSIVDVEAQISGNSVNQRPLILWLGRIGLTVPLGGGQVILLNCTSIIIQDQNLTNATIGVFLCFTRQSQVFNNTLTGHSANGIRIQNCEDITLSNNLCNNNSISGITLDQTVNTSLTENRCNYNSGGSGIHLDETYDNQLLNNTCLHNLTGIRLQSAYGTELLNNTCNQNRSDWGLWGFEYRGVGILISGNTNVARENFCNDNYIGIGIWGQENHVGENTCTNNTIGIFLNGDSTPIANNLCVNDIIGIYIYRYLETIIIDNSMVGCGLYIVYQGSEWTADVLIHGNRVNGRPLIFYKNQMNRQVPLGAGQIILFNCQRIIVR
ncbi:MAG: NosD domain-containing protein [Candidatus Hodarchaeota archaeon]